MSNESAALQKERIMTEIKNAFAQSRDTIIRDALGLAAIAVMFFVSLSLPGLV